jgi:hypothetical protein
LPASLFLTSAESHTHDIANNLWKRVNNLRTGALRRHKRTNVITVTAKAMGNEWRRNQCLGW